MQKTVFYEKRPSGSKFWGQPLKYCMSQKMWDAIIEDCPKNISQDQYVINTINEQFGLLGHVVEINIIED